MSPSENHHAEQSPNAAGAPFSMHTVLVALRCWWHLALPIGLMLSVAAAAAMFFLAKPAYTATMLLLIRERPLVLVQSTLVDDTRKFVENQIELLRSPLVLEPVVSDPKVATTPELANEADSVGYLQKKLRIRPLGKSDFFEIAFTSQSAEKAAVVVNKVGKEYYELQGRHESKANSRTIDLLQEQQLARQQSVRQLRTTLQDLSKQIYGKDAFAITQEKGQTVNPYAELEQRLITAQVEKETLAARIKAERELFEKESFEPSPSEVASQVDQVPQVQEVRRKLDATRTKLAEHKEKSVDLKKNSLYQQLEKQLRDDEAAVGKILDQLRTTTTSELERFARLKRQNSIAELEAQLRALDVSVQVWTERVKEKRGVQKEVAGDSLQYELVKADYERASGLLDAISSRILTMQTEQRAPERVEIFREASTPIRPDQAIPYKHMGMAAMFALLAPFALAVGVELLYRRVSNRSQLEGAGQISVVAEVTTLPARMKSSKGKTGINHGLRLFEESIDGLRTYLSLGESMQGDKVLAVTSATSGEGKTSIAAQLAVSVASATGRPTLLIDGDMRSPDLHRIFDLGRGPGLCEVLKGDCAAEEAIETGFSETLHLLTAGILDRSPHRLLGNNALGKLIAVLRETYENIIIDTPPVLSASEALVIASISDSAIVCVRRDYSRLDQVAETVSRLQAAGVKTAGAVLTGVPIRQYAYKYGSYYYDKDSGSSVA
jgi:succinoglycan biosynthesis transport protein ExoP